MEPNTPGSVKKEFFAPLQGLRGIAVLYVVLSHLGNAGLFLLPVPHQAIGKVGVWVFFSLSAFLLTTHLVRLLSCTTSSTGPVLQYTIHRFFRIYPLYLVVLGIHVALNNLSLNDLGAHLLLVQGWRELWAIPVEFQYYFVIPMVSIIAVRLRRQWAYLLLTGTLATSIVYGVAEPETVFSNGLNILPKLSPFLLGSTMALLVHHRFLPIEQDNRIISNAVILTSLGGLGLATVLYQCRSEMCIPDGQLPWLSVLLGLSVSGLMYSALQANWIARLLALKPLVYLGEISFSLYLLHLPIIMGVLKHFAWYSSITAWLAFGLSVAVASVTYRLIEKQGMQAGRSLSQRIKVHYDR